MPDPDLPVDLAALLVGVSRLKEAVGLLAPRSHVLIAILLQYWGRLIPCFAQAMFAVMMLCDDAL